MKVKVLARPKVGGWCSEEEREEVVVVMMIFLFGGIARPSSGKETKIGGCGERRRYLVCGSC